MSPPEVRLLVRLRTLRSQGVRFRRQHPVGPYVLDFYCAEARLAVEVDGFAHRTEDRPERDERRDAWLGEQGITVLRINAADVMADPDEVAQMLYRTVRGWVG
jgi:very-short-patch-repair endonuclease